MSRSNRTKGNASGLGISTRAKEIVADAQSADRGMARKRSPYVTVMEDYARHVVCPVPMDVARAARD
ncbi:MAG: hypothetical protein F4246_12375 [Rhodothermaceae bacterium]|nr:hypothetical protein [Rhodothermaceae bacterium]MXX57610.1 hypothetical protein [Rhodothermaceae bacterium]MYD20161.1 hypothetical protein [Rhodothermaceae bacterium]MYD57788.1 hypothetical protein [Rhodothermaceae bacterium]MYI44581.1 hypothetical protein [Rhodothermaceae bacterium]